MTVERQFVIAAIGEILWDVFPDGRRFGGAPANFACHIAGLGGQASMVSAVGTDELGGLAIDALQRKQVDTKCVARLDFPTGTVQVEIDTQGHPQYKFGEDEAWDHLSWSDESARLAQRSDAVCFGTLGQRSMASRQMIQQFVSATADRTLRVLDVNLRPPFFDREVIDQSLRLANAIKLNDEELPVLASTYGLSGTDAERMTQLARQFDLRLVGLTRGPRGAVLVKGDEVCEFPATKVSVQDTVGAGDSFTAAMTLGMLKGNSLKTIGQHACQVAAYVCSQPGATPTLPQDLCRF